MLKHLKVKNEDKYKNKKLMYFRINDEKLLEICKAIWTKIEENIELNDLPGYDARCIKTKIRTCLY